MWQIHTHSWACWVHLIILQKIIINLNIWSWNLLLKNWGIKYGRIDNRCVCPASIPSDVQCVPAPLSSWIWVLPPGIFSDNHGTIRISHLPSTLTVVPNPNQWALRIPWGLVYKFVQPARSSGCLLIILSKDALLFWWPTVQHEWPDVKPENNAIILHHDAGECKDKSHTRRQENEATSLIKPHQTPTQPLQLFGFRSQ